MNVWNSHFVVIVLFLVCADQHVYWHVVSLYAHSQEIFSRLAANNSRDDNFKTVLKLLLWLFCIQLSVGLILLVFNIQIKEGIFLVWRLVRWFFQHLSRTGSLAHA